LSSPLLSHFFFFFFFWQVVASVDENKNGVLEKNEFLAADVVVHMLHRHRLIERAFRTLLRDTHMSPSPHFFFYFLRSIIYLFALFYLFICYILFAYFFFHFVVVSSCVFCFVACLCVWQARSSRWGRRRGSRTSCAAKRPKASSSAKGALSFFLRSFFFFF